VKPLKLLIITLLCLSWAEQFGQGYSVTDLDFNSEYPDYAPSLFGEELVFCSHRKNNLWVTVLDSSENNLSDLYVISRKDGELTGRPKLFASEISTLVHEGPACFNVRGDLVYFTRNIDTVKSSRKRNHLGIYMSRLDDGKWTEPSALSFNSENNKYDVAHPALSADGSRLYFSSNMPGGLGKSDIYVCYKEGDAWSEPKNLGPEVNSEEIDAFPFVDERGRLYFATNGRTDSTDLDIHYTIEDAGSWTVPFRLDEPLNSSGDDYGMIMNPDGESGYFSSNRNAGDDNIFEFRFEYPEFGGCNEIQKPIFCYLLKEEKIVRNDSMPLVYEWDFGDGTTARGLESEHCFPDFGYYHVALNIYDTITGAQYAQVSEMHLMIEKFNQPYITGSDTAWVNEEMQFSSEETELEGFSVDEFFWETGDGNKKRGEQISHTYTEAGVYYVVLGATSIPDNGNIHKTCAYKEVVVMDEAMQAELARQDSIYQAQSLAYAEEMAALEEVTSEIDSSVYFIELTESAEKIPLNDPYFEQIDYEITERFTDTDSLYRYSVGEAYEVVELYNIYKDLVSKGYSESLVKETDLDMFSGETMRKGIYMPDSVRAAMNREINKFSDIQYDLNSHTIQRASFDNLDYIVDVMRMEPDLRLKIGAHTDNTGSEEYNLDLSEKRALSVVEYLEGKNIDRERLQWIGFGNSMPASDNSTEQGRARNRRVEFEILVENILRNDPNK
jgi:outer membrane protein OmpA-like peptidoglycan-associated protein/Tol biopolymer transport system component